MGIFVSDSYHICIAVGYHFLPQLKPRAPEYAYEYMYCSHVLIEMQKVGPTKVNVPSILLPHS